MPAAAAEEKQKGATKTKPPLCSLNPSGANATQAQAPAPPVLAVQARAHPIQALAHPKQPQSLLSSSDYYTLKNAYLLIY